MEQLELSYPTEGNVKWYNHIGKQFSNFFKKKLNLNSPYKQAISFLDIHPREMKLLYLNAYGSFIWNGTNLETQMLINKWMEK